MDPASFCVYNVTRNTLLSERVISVAEPQTPSQLLALVMNGPGRDPHFCIRLTDVSVTPDIPRLFAFDVAYLDTEQRILQVADVGPGTPFPDLTDQVASVLFLSDQLLARSNSEIGDFIRICTEAELAALLRATAQFHAVEPLAPQFESAAPQIAPDPFDGSLIYLPASGTPQTREIFLSPHAPQFHLAHPLVGELAEMSSNLLPQEVQLPDQSSQPFVDAIQLLQQSDPVESGQSEPSLTDSPPVTRFFEAASHHVPSPETPPGETQQTPPSPPSQLPFSLKAVIQLVDDQLRREKQPQERTHPQHLPEKNSEPADVRLANPFLVPDTTSHLPEITPENISLPHATAAPLSQPPALFKPAQPPEPAVKPSQPLTSLPAVDPPLAPSVESQPYSSPTTEELSRPIAGPSKEKLPFSTRVQRWLAGESISISGNRRRGQRIALPGLVAFYFTGGAPKPHEIINISTSGLYLRSKEQWYPNTLVRMTMERQHAELDEKKSITVLARVVRIDDEGIGHEFVTNEVLTNLRAQNFLPQQGTNRKELERFLANPK
jgi:hypothetical protein